MANSLHFMRTPLCAFLALSTAANAQGHKPKTDAEHIANAMSAGPSAISRDATIMAMDGDKMRTIRQGKNEFTCVSDDPSSPGNDPMCLDKNAMEWLMALGDHKDAPKGKMGLVYMLQADRTPVTMTRSQQRRSQAKNG